MPNVYVMGAKLPAGGAYMAYRLGQLLARHFGYNLIDVQVSTSAPEIFSYDAMQSVGVRQMEKTITASDILIANPSFSEFFFGARFPGKKIMYAQGFQTFSALDCQFDLYVAASGLVQNYVQAMYGIKAPIIAPFIELENFPAAKPWRERPENSALVYIKHHDLAHRVAYEFLKEKNPHLDFSNVHDNARLTHAQFLERIGAVRYFVNLSLAEGFGLPALEAMAMGTLVTGLDGLAGVDFMRSGENCLVTSVKQLPQLPHVVQQAFSDEALALRCVEAGRKTAQNYSYQRFKQDWLAQLFAFLKQEPAHVG